MNEDSTFYIDAASFPGNSGSPVFVKPSLARFDNKENYALGGDTIGGRSIGIIGGYLTYQDVAVSRQTGHDRISFEENTGLSKVWSVSFINEILNSEPFKEQIKRIKP
ncbi:MAG: hypothetical protein WCF23_04980 [Candidatus Nitrosopolaris sp.]